MDQINIFCIILEQVLEWQREIYFIFVDFEKVFDMLKWLSIWFCLLEIGVLLKIVCLLESIYRKYFCRVIYNGFILEDIVVYVGVC